MRVTLGRNAIIGDVHYIAKTEQVHPTSLETSFKLKADTLSTINFDRSIDIQLEQPPLDIKNQKDNRDTE